MKLTEELLKEIGVADVVHGRMEDAVDHEARLRHAGLLGSGPDEGILVGRHIEMLLHCAVLGVEQPFQRLLHVYAIAAGQLRQRELLLAVDRRLADEVRDGRTCKARLGLECADLFLGQPDADHPCLRGGFFCHASSNSSRTCARPRSKGGALASAEPPGSAADLYTHLRWGYKYASLAGFLVYRQKIEVRRWMSS